MAVITLKGLIGGTDAICNEFLTQTYPSLASMVSMPIFYIAVLYWAVYGVKIQSGYESASPWLIVKRATMTALIFASLNWGGVAKWLYTSFAAFMEGSAATIWAGQPTATMLDALYNDVGRVATTLQNAGWQSIGVILLGYGLFILNCILFVVAVCYMLLAKFGLAIAMVLLPLFLGFFMFETSRQWGINWISKMLNFCFIYILAIAVVRFGFFAFGDAITEAGNAAKISDAAKITAKQVAYLSVVEGVLIIFLLQVKGWAAALSGGAQVQGLTAALSVARMFLPKPVPLPK